VVWHDSIIKKLGKSWKILEKNFLTKKRSRALIGQAFISPSYWPRFFSKTFFQDFIQDFAKKAAFFEAAFFGKSWPNLGKRNLFLNRKMVSC
jgi:hypothetical protein